MFKAIFLNEANKDFVCKLIAELIGIDYEYLLENMTFYKNDVNKKKHGEKSRRVDLMIKLGEKYIGVNRNFLYAIKTAMVDRKEGDIHFSPIIEINFNNYFYEDFDMPICHYGVIPLDCKYQNHTAEKLIIIEVYLPLIRKKCYNELNKAERIILAMFETSKAKVAELAEGDEVLVRYNEVLEEAQKDEELLEAYDHDEVHFELGRDEGIKLGISQGIEQKTREIILKLFETGMSVEELSERLEIEVEKIREI